MGIKVSELRKKRFPGHGGQADAAREFGVSRSTWNNYESRENLSNKTLKKLSDFFGVTVDELRGESTAVLDTGKEHADQAKPAGAFTVISSDGGETVKHYLEALGRLATFVEPILAGKIPLEQAANGGKILEALADGFLAAIDKANTSQELEKCKKGIP